MRIPPSRETRHAAEAMLRAAVHPFRPDIPVDAVTIESDEQGLWSAQIYGVEQALQTSGESLQREVVERLAHWRPRYGYDEIAALLKTLHIIAAKSGVALPRDALRLTELPDGVLVLTLNGAPVVASEDPLHLLSQALLRLRAALESRH